MEEEQKLQSTFKIGIRNNKRFLSCDKDCEHLHKNVTEKDKIYFCEYFIEFLVEDEDRKIILPCQKCLITSLFNDCFNCMI